LNERVEIKKFVFPLYRGKVQVSASLRTFELLVESIYRGGINNFSRARGQPETVPTLNRQHSLITDPEDYYVRRILI
jgi:hypothetical protein